MKRVAAVGARGFLLCALLTAALPAFADSEWRRVKEKKLGELSGLAASRAQAGTHWAHNDDGGARLFAIRADGAIAAPAVEILGARNVDWEDIARDAGTLYIADTGNNDNDRRDLGVYEVPEPSAGALQARAKRFIRVRYPDQTAFPPAHLDFDCEALFVDRGALYFVTKHRESTRKLGFGAKLYRLRLSEVREGEVNVLALVGSTREVWAATGAAVSPNGKRLALLSQNGIWLLDRPAEGDDWLGARRAFLPSSKRGLEAIEWIDDAVLLVGTDENDRETRSKLRRFEASDAKPLPAN
jgi:hypothetical protein